MDIFGSNATPMGGDAGRCDAIIGAVEAQKAEGLAPGPYCLLKLLRHRFGLASDAGATQEEKYGVDEAIIEYHQRQAEQKRYLALRKLRGSLYKCFDCEKELPRSCTYKCWHSSHPCRS
jgi:hypothetical protein